MFQRSAVTATVRHTPAWLALLSEPPECAPAEPEDAWACSSFHASSWELRHGLEVTELEWADARPGSAAR